MPRRPALRPAVALALALGAASPAAASNGNPELAGGPGHPTPIFRTDRTAAPPGARLGYFGGRVLANVDAVMVLWGDGAFAPYVTGEQSPSLAAFLAAVAGSPYVSGLAEYDTSRVAVGGGPGTGQHVGPGTFRGEVRIAPANAGDVVDDSAISAELAAQLEAGTLPRPRADAAGNLETLYLVYFPAGKRITLDGGESCRSFCAYHGAFAWRGHPVAYAVMPDLSPGSGCELGCGSGAPFANGAEVASHELAEAITDPDVALAAEAGPPLAWYDPLNGEIGDLCVGEAGTVTGSDDAPWPVQKLWSNAAGACVVPAAPVAVAPLVASSQAPAAIAPATPAVAAAPAAPVPLADAAPRVGRAAAMPLHAPPPRDRPALAALPRALPAEPSPLPLARGTRVAVEEENDALGAGRHPSDQEYTQGLRISATWALHDGAPDARHEVGFAVGQNIYTPSDLRTTDLSVLRHDRPYAGWLYAAALLRTVDAAPFALRLGADAAGPAERTTEIELAVGVTGRPSGGADVQERFHALLRQWSGNPTSPPAPAGWSAYQVATQPTLDTSVRHEVALVGATASLGDTTARTGAVLGARLAPRLRIDVGAILDAASAGLELRAGLLPAGRGGRAALPFQLYAFARADGRYVLANALVSGRLSGGVTPLVAVRPWVGDLDVGAVLRLGRLEVGYGQLWRTSELTPNPPGARRIHDVGQVTVALVSG